MQHKSTRSFDLSAAKENIPTLRFTPYAWAKLLFFRDAGMTEIGGFGISGITTADLLLIEDFVTVRQVVTEVTVAFDDAAVADYFDQQVTLSRQPEQFGRIWIHTHPGSSPAPSTTDEETFARVFGSCTWAIMFILAKGGATYCRLGFHVGPGGTLNLPTRVDFVLPFPAPDHEAWKAEYDQNVIIPSPQTEGHFPDFLHEDFRELFAHSSRNYRDEPDMGEQQDLREALLEEYMAYWGEDREVFE